MELRLSIIIPVYNTEQWIGRCLDSCLHQDISHEEYEIIVVNDGTRDNSMAIVADYAAKYGNIRVIEQANGGASKARNKGITEARGEYIWFIDSDDYIRKNCLTLLSDKATRDNLDVLCFDERMTWNNGNTNRIPLIFEESGKVYDGKSFIENVEMPHTAWQAWYKRSLLEENNIRFIEGIMYEDQDFPLRAYYLSKRASYINEVIYYYFQREGSLMSTLSSHAKKRAESLLDVADSLYAFTIEYVETESIAYDKIMNRVNFAFCQSLINYKDEMFAIEEYKNKPYYPLIINKYQTRKEQIKHSIINFSVRFYLFLYRLLK